MKHIDFKNKFVYFNKLQGVDSFKNKNMYIFKLNARCCPRVVASGP